MPPRDGIMVPTPERKTTTIKADVDDRVPREVALASAEAIFAYRPIDVVDRISPRAAMFICVENDATTPEDHASRCTSEPDRRSVSWSRPGPRTTPRTPSTETSSPR